MRKTPSYIVTVQQNGQVVIRPNYIEKMGLRPGDEIQIKLGRKYIYLCPINNDEDE